MKKYVLLVVAAFLAPSVVPSVVFHNYLYLYLEYGIHLSGEDEYHESSLSD